MWPSMQRGQCPIFNGTFEIFVCPSSREIFVFKLIETRLFTFKFISLLDKYTLFNGYRCESGIDLWHTGRRYLKEIKICFSSYWISTFWKASDKKMEIVRVKKNSTTFAQTPFKWIFLLFTLLKFCASRLLYVYVF